MKNSFNSTYAVNDIKSVKYLVVWTTWNFLHIFESRKFFDIV